MPPPDARLRGFEAQRPRLLRLAYRMLGSVAEAEDIVQDAWLRWDRVEESVDAPAAYLTRVTTRLCLDQMKSARVRRETYIGAWLPEPLVGTTEIEEEADDLSLTLMMALERLSPLERAAFLLHDVFGVGFDEVASTLERDAPAVRQLAVRARKHVHYARPRFKVEQAEADRIARAFFTATREGDVGALSRLLADDVVIKSDGGGRVLAFRNPIRGVDRALRLFASLAHKPQHQLVALRRLSIDGLPGMIARTAGGLIQTTALEIADGRITAIYIVRNPDKLRHAAAVLEDSVTTDGSIRP